MRQRLYYTLLVLAFITLAITLTLVVWVATTLVLLW